MTIISLHLGKKTTKQLKRIELLLKQPREAILKEAIQRYWEDTLAGQNAESFLQKQD